MFKSIFRLLGRRGREANAIHDVESLNDYIEDHLLQSSERDIIENLLSFRDLKVSEVMIPRTDLVGIANTATFQEIKQQFITTGFTKMPVYRDSLDDIIGFIHIKDFMHDMDGMKTFAISEMTRQIIYSPRSTKCIDLLSNMRNSTTHVAVILDEYGGTDGMVIIENLIEKIVGDIRDEHDKATKVFITQINEESYYIDARAAIQDVEEVLCCSLSQEEGDYETFGGFVLSYLDKVPVTGEKIMYPMGFEIEIIDAEPRKIKNTKVTLLNTSELVGK